MTFGEATSAARNGEAVTREGWNEPDIFAYIVPANAYPAQTGVAKKYFGENSLVPYREYWALKTKADDIIAWTPSGFDTNARDWKIVNVKTKE